MLCQINFSAEASSKKAHLRNALIELSRAAFKAGSKNKRQETLLH